MKNQTVDQLFFEGHLSDEGIALYADSLALIQEAHLPAPLLEHVEECLQCKKEVFAIFEIIKTNSTDFEEVESSKNHKPQSNRLMVLKVAASLLLVVGLSVLVYLLIHHKQIQNQDASLPETKDENIAINQTSTNPKKDDRNPDQPIPQKQTTFVSNIEESVIFESLISSQYRGNDMETISPSLNKKFTRNQPITFSFQTDLPGPFLIKIYKNNGDKIFETAKFDANNYSLNKKLLPGLYYWKLEKDDDLIHVGKFYINPK